MANGSGARDEDEAARVGSRTACGGGAHGSAASMEMARLFKRVMRIAVELDKELAQRHDLALTDLACLGFLESSEAPVTGRMIADHVGLSTGATTALLDRLERSSLIERRPNPADRRGIVITLISENSDPILNDHRHIRDRLQATFENLTEGEARTVSKFLKTLVDEFEAL
ncbi:MarR family winged helix-turn-helix transcriptional regulator [Fulvimarina sp. MAC3]|uniref:MarR family winged helix-turn-helix transcriptional regulator n=1 Tax=Fulvimarina sp. MAC3 TaxID=3148887 RepID=UPI0031FCE622